MMPGDSFTPPPGAKSIDQILVEARSHLQRVTPSCLHRELNSPSPGWGPTHLIDIRPAAQRAFEGPLALTLSSNPGTSSTVTHRVHIVERNVLEWRVDPQSGSRTDDIIREFGYETRIVVVCSEGYTSSLAASELQRLGLANATDLDGGYCAWKAFLEECDSGSVKDV